MEHEADYITGDWWRTEDAWREGGETWLDLSKATRIQFVQAPDGEWQCELWAGQTFTLRGAEAERLRLALLLSQAPAGQITAPEASDFWQVIYNQRDVIEALERRVASLECWRLCQTGD